MKKLQQHFSAIESILHFRIDRKPINLSAKPYAINKEKQCVIKNMETVQIPFPVNVNLVDECSIV